MRWTMGVIPAALAFAGLVCGSDPSIPVAKIPPKPEAYLMLPEPRVMRSANSRAHAGAQRTVFTPARRTDEGAVVPWTKEEFARLGISWDTFLDRAERTADRMLAGFQPEFKKDGSGRVLYGVYRGDEPVMACLLVAPSLGMVFERIFGAEIWLVAPDRHSLFVFPARNEAVAEFAADLKERFEENPFAASDEIFALGTGSRPLHVVGSFGPAR